MKRILLLVTAIIMAAATGVSAKGGQTIGERLGDQDTITVKMANGAKMVLYLQNMKQLKAFENYSLDSLMRVLNKYVDQVEKMDSANQDLKSKETTVTFGQDGKDPEQVTITVQETDQDGKTTKERHEIRINKNIRIDVEVEENNGNTRVDVNIPDKAERDSIRYKEDHYKSTKFNFDIDLGLNNFVNEDNQLVPDLKPMGSRYVSLNSHLTSQIGGRKSPFHIVTGLEFAFNNFMFDKNYVIEEDVNENTYFRRETEIDYDKSKLATSSVNIPLMPMLKFKKQNGKDGFKIGAGGFAGYRLGAHSKLKYDEGGDSQKDKIRSSYNLTDFQYGLTGMIGYGDLDLFIKYNMNDLFKDNRGPDANVISFGFRLFY